MMEKTNAKTMLALENNNLLQKKRDLIKSLNYLHNHKTADGLLGGWYSWLGNIILNSIFLIVKK